MEAPGAYAAIRVGRGDLTIVERVFKGTKKEGNRFQSPPGYIVLPSDDYAPVVLEVMAKNKVASFADFKSKVKDCQVSFEEDTFRYTTIYGDRLTLDTGYQHRPTINGKPVDYAPEKVFDSPFLKSDYLSGVITISKGDREKVLDFTSE